MFKMEAKWDGKKLVLRLSGRMQTPQVEQLESWINNAVRSIALDLEEVRLVDLDVVRFLSTCEAQGIELQHCAAYIREWIRRESARQDRDF